MKRKKIYNTRNVRFAADLIGGGEINESGSYRSNRSFVGNRNGNAGSAKVTPGYPCTGKTVESTSEEFEPWL
jgi:hypothetical protein